MSADFRVRGACDAMLAVGLFIAAISGAAWATPVLTPFGEEPSALRQMDDQPAETRPAAAQPKPPLPARAPEAAETRGVESAFRRNLVPEPTHAPPPNPRRNAPPSEVDLQLKELFRQLAQLFADRAGVSVAGRERAGWDSALDFGRGDVHFLGFGGAMTWDPLASAPPDTTANFPSGGYEDFTFTPIGGRRSVDSAVHQPAYSESYGNSPSHNEYASARAATASSQWSPPQSAGSGEHLVPFMDAVRDVLTDPVTVMVALGWLLLWLFLETVQWGPGGRRRRRRV